MDAKAIENARHGDRHAQARVLQGLQDRWFRFCLGLLRDPDRARDATQETAVRFLQRLPTWRGDGSIQTWSFGIALNVVRELRRTRATNDETFIAGSAGRPDESIDALEQRDLLRNAINELPDRQREAIILRYFEDLTNEETASAMNCAVGTVKATVHQALRSLRNKLRQLA